MQTFKDYLIYYNNLDTAPFCSALKNFFEIYKSQGIDIFKEYITLPGVARKMLYNSTASNFALFNLIMLICIIHLKKYCWWA